MTTIAGCRHIAESIRNSIFSPHYEELQRTLELGPKPETMPLPSITPSKVLCNSSNVQPAIEGLPLTWLKIHRHSPWGVYYSVIALYGDHHWVTQDQSGVVFLRIYEDLS